MTPKGGDVRVHVETGKLDLSDVKLGDSIAVNGVCLTAVELPGNGFGPTSAAKPSTAPP
jgi:riboflavin synthase